MTNEQKQLEFEASEVLEMLEDMVEYVCKEHTISGEKVYFMINELSRIKLQQFPQDPDIDQQHETDNHHKERVY